MQGGDYRAGWVMKDLGCPGDFDKVIIIPITGNLRASPTLSDYFRNKRVD